MKKGIVLVLIVLLSHSVLAQQETLFSGEIANGWYGAPLFKTGQILGETGFWVGGQGGWIINHRFVLGGKGYILVNPVTIEGLENIEIGFGCGGVLFEYIIASNKLLHFSVESMIGAGGVYNDVNNYSRYHDPIDYTGDGCFVAEPGINLMLNVTKYFRVGGGVSYRYVNGIEYDAGVSDVKRGDYDLISDSDLTGVSVQIVLKFGSF